MRPIKFRAWDTKKQMFTGWPIALTIKPKVVYQKQSNGSLNILPYILTKDAKTNSWIGEATSKYILQQFTGLIDKNGKEIYEGDCFSIDKRQSNGSETRVGIAFVRWYDKELCFNLDDTLPSGEQNIFWYAKNKKVIGNIYENPELLTPSK